MLTGILAFLMDTVIGDPRTRFHPVALMGSLIAFLDRIFYREEDSDAKKLVAGAVLAILVLLISYHVSCAILQLSYRTGSPWVESAIAAVLLSFMISP